MKKHIIFALAAMMMAACTHSNEPENNGKAEAEIFAQTKNFAALGTSTVLTEPVFEQDSVMLLAELTSDTTLRLSMLAVTFSERMPVTIDMALDPVSYTRSEKLISFSGEDIIPTAGGKPYDRYKATALKGTITPDSLCLSATLGTYPITYRGAIQQ